MIAIQPNLGFECIKHIITIWTVKHDKYEFNTILDHWLEEGIGYHWIEDRINIDNKRKVIVGRSEGGDEGYTWGSLWLGLWEMPREFKIIYFSRWSVDPYSKPQTEEIKYKLNKSTKEITVTNVIKDYKVEKNNHWVLLDSSWTDVIIKIDTLLDNDLTIQYNHIK
jgi:hypothetical protein